MRIVHIIQATTIAVLLLVVPVAHAELVGYWAFDEGAGTVADDSSGNNNDGILGANASWEGAGYLGGNALSFNGTDGSHVRVADDSSLRFSSSDDYTVSFWARVDALSGVWQTLLWKGEKPARYSVMVSPRKDIRFVSGRNSAVASPFDATPGAWQHVAAIQEAGHPSRKRRLYIDGVEVASRSSSQQGNGLGDLFIGSRRADDYESFVGDLDEVRIYDHALSDSEIQALANETPGPVLPVANAGPDQTVLDADGDFSESVTLDGSASSSPGGSIVHYLWSDQSGVLAQGPSATAILDFGIGNHSVELTVTDDGSLMATDSVVISVNPQPVNVAPLVDAGPNLAVALGDELYIEGASVTDDGLPVPPGAVSVFWSEEGSAVAAWPLGDEASVATHVVFSAVGTYVLRLTADDGLLTAFDEVSVTVSGNVATPVIAPPGGIFESPVQVSLSTTTGAATIFYTVDGSDPDQTSAAYTGAPVLIDQDTILRARAYAVSLDPSEIAAASFVFQPVPSDGLAGHWAFDEGAGFVAGDSSGNSHDGALGANAGWVGTGYLGGNALSVNGTAGSHVRVPDDSSLRFGQSDDYTVAFWARVDSLPGAWQTFLWKGAKPTRLTLSISPGNKIQYSAGNYSAVRSPTEMAVGSWQHVAAIQEAGHSSRKRRLYINGIEVASDSSAQAADAPGDLFIGSRRSDSYEAFDGDLDEVRIYDRALSDAEIQSLFNDTTQLDPPLANDDSATTAADTPVAIPVLANDSDPNGDPLAISAVESPTANGGTAVINDNGTPADAIDDFIDYTPASGFAGDDTFTYTISDGNGGTDTATVTVTVDNAVPVANDDAASTATGVPVAIAVLANDSDPNNDPLTITAVESPTANSGSTSINDNGTPADPSDDFIDYTPASGFAGDDTFTYTISDGNGGSDTATVTVTVDNAVPVANDDAASTATGVPVAIAVLANDSDPNNDPLTITAVESPTANSGSTSINDNGTPAEPSDDFIDYTPASGFAGDDTFTYTISDGNGGTDTATVTVTVDNAVPVANDDAASTATGVPVAIAVLANDSDPNNDPLTITAVESPTANSGSTSINDNGTPADPSDDFIDYTPASGFAGDDTFTYTISDGSGGTGTATVTVTVDSASPVALDDSATTAADTPVAIAVLANDSDPNGDPLAISAVESPTTNSGTASINDNGTPADPGDDFIDYTPASGFAGDDTFTYTISDGNGGTDTATVTVTVDSASPIAVDDSATTAADTPVAIAVLANDSDPNGDPLAISAVESPTANGGTAVINDNGTPADAIDDFIDYTPASGFAGDDTFTYTISDGNGGTDTATVTVTVDNAVPVANDDAASTATGVPVAIAVLANDSDPNNDPLTITAVESPTANGGTASINDNGTPADPSDDFIDYTPASGFAGDDTFTYTISDGNGGTDTATVTVTVDNAVPVANDDAASTATGVPVAIAVLANDSDPNNDPLTITAVESPTANSGSTSINDNGTPADPSDDFIDYTPASGFAGDDTFTYTISDGSGGTGTATVTVTVDSASPVALDDSATTAADTPVAIAVLANDSDPNGDPLAISAVESPTTNSGTASINDNGTPADPGDDFIDYTPASGFAGDDTFTYTISDGNGGTDTATVTVTVDSASPIAVDDSATTAADTPVAIAVLANDSDPNGDPLAISAVESPTANGGTAVINDNGTPADAIDDFIDYTPASGFAGDDTFTYTISDGNGGTDTATVTVTVDNAVPVANDDAASTATGVPVAIAVLANDSDPNNDPLTITAVESPTANSGSTSINDNGTPADPSDDFIDYTPASGFAGDDTFTYTISDGNGGTDTATVTVTVDNAVPVANDDAASTATGVPVAIAVLANDSDPNNDPLTITAVESPTANSGSTSINDNGTPADPSDDFIDYTPASGFAGDDTFTYTISDGSGGTGTATVTVTVDSASPVALDDSATTAADTPVAIAVLANDSDPNGDPLAISAVESPTTNSGTASINDNGTPADPGDDFIDYTPASGFAGDDTFTYTISDGNGGADTAMVTVTVTVAGNVATPEVTPPGGIFESPVEVLLSTTTGAATIYYTEDGSDPDQTSAVYTGAPVLIDQDTTLRARAYAVSLNPSEIATASFVLQPVSTDGLVGHWAFDEGSGVVAGDSSGNSHDGALGASADWEGTGYLGGNALSVNGTTGSHVRVADAPSLRFGASDDYTVSFWLRVDAHLGGWQAVLWRGSYSNRYSFMVAPNNKIQFGAANNTAVKSPAEVAVGSWQHVAAIQEAGHSSRKRRLYVDGIEVASHASAQAADAPGDLFIGSRKADAYEAFVGDLDEVRIFGRALSDAEILALSSQIPGPAPPVANDDVAVTPVDTPAAIYVLANDSDPNGDVLSIIASDSPTTQGGSTAVNANNTPGNPADDFIDYTPPAQFTGTDSFTYVIDDGNGATGVATVTVTVEVNQTPTDIQLDNSAVSERPDDGTLVGILSTSDPNSGDIHTYSLIDDAGGRFIIGGISGDELLVANGDLLDVALATSHDVSIRTTDNGGATLEKLFTITVLANDAPVVIISSHLPSEDVFATGFLLSGNVTDDGGVDSLTVNLDDPILGRTLDQRPVEFAAASGQWSLVVFDGQISLGQTITVSLTAIDWLGRSGTTTIDLQVTAANRADRQLINRITFGATPALLQEVKMTGAANYVAQQMDPASIDDTDFENIINGLNPTTLSELKRYQVLHAVYSRRQLREVMTWFWDNHFNTDVNKHGNVQFELNENNLFRANALGSFRDLLEISAKSPAMVIYLDNVNSVKANPNENYSRELMELHTLGVNGGYSQNDVEEIARAFTGWTVQNDQFFFDASEHDTDPKTVLGQAIDSGGVGDGEQVLDLLANHASTASYICTKLIVLLVSDNPPAPLVGQCATTFQAAGEINAPDQIAQVLGLILGSAEFSDPAQYLSKVKTPIEFVVGTARYLQATGSFDDLSDATHFIGMPLFENHIPTGYSETGDDWISSNLMLERMKFVNDIAYNSIGGAGASIEPLIFFPQQGFETSEGIIGYLAELVFGEPLTQLEWDTALGVMTEDGSSSFDIQAADADDRLRRLIGTVLSYPATNYQ